MRYIYICVNILIKGKSRILYNYNIIMTCWEHAIIMLIDSAKTVTE